MSRNGYPGPGWSPWGNPWDQPYFMPTSPPPNAKQALEELRNNMEYMEKWKKELEGSVKKEEHKGTHFSVFEMFLILTAFSPIAVLIHFAIMKGYVVLLHNLLQ